VHNRYFDCTPLSLFTGVVRKEGIGAPSEIQRRVARLETAAGLIVLLAQELRGKR